MSWIGWAVGGVVLAAGGYVVWRKLEASNRLATERYRASFASVGGSEIHKQNVAERDARAAAGEDVSRMPIAAAGGIVSYTAGTARIG